MWWILLTLILVISAIVQVVYGSRAAIGTGLVLSLAFPCWVVQEFFRQPIDLRIATTLVLLVLRVIDRRQPICWWFNPGDWAIFAMYFIHVASDTYQDGFSISHIVMAFGEWSTPYIAGRLAIEAVHDWHWLTGLVVVLSLFFAALATTESVTRVNLMEIPFGQRPEDRTPRMAIRAGFKRANGPVKHPIWFGMIQCQLLAFTITAAVRAVRGDGKLWWLVAPMASVLGVMATLSRGPILAAIATFYFFSIFYWKQLRIPLISLGVVAAMAVIAMPNTVLMSLQKFERSSNQKIELEGERHSVSEMSPRWLVLKAYRHAIDRAGLLGFGSGRTSSFPVNVPMGPDAATTTSKLWTIDVEYLLILLRFGWLGLAAFAMICVTSIWHIARQLQFCEANQRIVPSAIAATLLATTLSFFVEWMPADYGFLFLWLCGAANGIRGNALMYQPVSLAKVSSRSLRRMRHHKNREPGVHGSQHE